MFNLIFVALFAIIGTVFFFIEGNSVSETPTLFVFQIIGIVSWVLSMLVLIISTANCLKTYSGQLKRFEDLRADLRKIPLLEEKSKQLIEEFKSYLGEKYPEIEKEIFKNISGAENSDAKLKFILTHYPEIHSSEVFSDLTGRINKLIGDLYNRKEKMENECSSIRYYANGKWELFKPSVPEDIKLIVYSHLKNE